jgi:hypothetical protein
MPRRLRAVDPDEKPAKARKLSVSEAAVDGSHRQLLEALRDKIAKTIESTTCHPRDLATLSYRLQQISRELLVEEAADGDGDGIGRVAAIPDAAWDGAI